MKRLTRRCLPQTGKDPSGWEGERVKILCLGGAGFIGCHTVERLLRDTQHQVIVFDRCDQKLTSSLSHPRLRFVNGDIRECRTEVKALVQSADVVVDLIAHANPSLYVDSPLEVFELNFTENLKIAHDCIEYGKRLVQFSTCEVYGMTPAAICAEGLKDPQDPRWGTFSEESPSILGPISKHRWIYACGKQLLERVLHAYGLEGRLNYTIIRPFNFIGPKIDYLPSQQQGNPRVFSHFLDALLHGGKMQLVDGGLQRRSYSYIDDATNCIVRILEDEKGVCDGEIFNIGTPGNETTIRGLAQLMLEIYRERWWDGKSSLPSLVEVSSEEFYGRGYEDCDRRIPDVSKAERLLGWKAVVDLRSTVERSMAFWCD